MHTGSVKRMSYLTSSGAGKRMMAAAAVCLIALSCQAGPAFTKDAESGEIVGDTPTVFKISARGHTRLAARVLIHARPEVVWQSVHEERQKDPDIAYAKVLSKNNNEVVLEEKFAFLPVIGTARCIMKDIEVPNSRIDYWLLESDHFKALEGSWVLKAAEGGRATILELSSYLELGLLVPRVMLEGVTSHKLVRRMNNVKALAEKIEAGIASSGSNG